MKLFDGGSATISSSGVYRYDLVRQWGDGNRVCWIMLNPSTADEDNDDPTIRRCIGFSQSWGFGSLVVVNRYALRTTHPRLLREHMDPRGPLNDGFIANHLRDAELAVVAWGAFHVGGVFPVTGSPVNEIARRIQKSLFCLGTTKDGSPRHPLYVKGDTSYRPYLGTP